MTIISSTKTYKKPLLHQAAITSAALRIVMLVLLLLPVNQEIRAQELQNDTLMSVAADTMPEKEEEIHSPRKAALYSAMLPGLGQAYNRKYWKIPLVYGGFAAFGYFIGWNNDNFLISKNAYLDLTDDDENTNSYLKLKYIEYYDLSNPAMVDRLKDGLIKRQNYFRRNRDFLVILSVAFYGLNIIDASVDAHFFNWDISDNLTMKWQPSFDQVYNQNLFSLNCTISF